MSDPHTSHSIKSWAEDDRPREKLVLKGRSALSDAELLAVQLGSGSRDESAVDLAKRILKSVDHNLHRLGQLDITNLTDFKGVGVAKAVNIISALELGNRRRLAEALEMPKITSSKIAYNLLQPQLEDLSHEEFWVLYLNQQNKVLQSSCISKGGITGTVADVRMIMRGGLLQSATGMILAHNHPSGGIKPSQADRNLTQNLKKAGQIMNIPVLDHIIIGRQRYYSFADEGEL